MEEKITTENQKIVIDPDEYFARIKKLKQTNTEEELDKIYQNAIILLEKYKKTGQKKAARKLIFHIENIERERDIIKLGVNQFVYRETIEDYIDNVASDVVKIIELENYERDIPNEIVDLVEKTKDIFSNFYVLFTDYTGKIEKEVEKEKRKKDPILFGAFVNKETDTVIERFYYLGDWEDEYCDLTLDKFVNEMEISGREDIVKNINIPKTLEEMKAQVNSLRMVDNMIYVTNNKPKKSFFAKIKTFLSRRDKNGNTRKN